MLMSEVTGFSILFAAVGLLFIGLSVPLILGRVPPNHFYGCRTQRTLSDPTIWYEANRVSGKDFFIAGVLIFVASLVTLVFGRGANPDHVVITLLSVLVLSVAVAAWHCFTVGRRV
jgi:uncharacterized membrane protein